MTGHIEQFAMSRADFEAERRMFDQCGYAHDPEQPDVVVGNARAVEAIKDSSALVAKPSIAHDRLLDQKSPTKRAKKQRLPMGDPADVGGFSGPWAGFSGENIGKATAPTEEELSRYISEKSQVAPATLSETIALGQEHSVFHGKSERDYLGRTVISPPQDAGMRLDKEMGNFECFVPKKLIHTWTGHTKGVNAIRFFPKSGHLLLSASQDQRIKLWDVYQERSCLRTFYGHNKPVRDICFDHSGHRFASCAYDRTLKHWDTETGKCLFAMEHSAIPYCVRIHPDADKAHILMAGTGDRKVMQWDMRSGKVVQEYNQHLDAVNSITFFDDNRRFISSSDDKSLRVWDYDIPVTIKYIADPEMHSMPCAALHPTEPYMAFQSLNNRIMVYSVQDRLQARHKKFVGHSTAGYACQVGFSPDGRYLISGDGRGQLVVWDWKSGQISRRIEAHSQVCIGVEWNPQDPSRVATCSWDGTIKYWD